MINDFLLHVDFCLTPYENIHNASLLFRDGRIVAVGGHSALRALEDIPSLHLPGCTAIPGLVDTHLHGSGGFDVMNAEINSDLTGISSILAAHGVTSFVVTILSAPIDRMLSITNKMAKLCRKQYSGANPLGIHFEGPYLSPKQHGAQDSSALRPIDLGEAKALIRAAEGTAKFMTLAPERQGADRLIEMLVEHNVVASMGHSTATEVETLRAIKAGASRCTHMFNGMPKLNQREVGLTCVALTEDKLTVEIIVDGVHVHPRMVNLACRSKPLDKLVGVSDATQGAGLPDGIYHLGGDEVEIRHGCCRRVSDGVLAGSGFTLDRVMRNLAEYTSLTERQAVACCTANAAKSVGLDDRGVISPGKRADIAVLDANREVVMSIVNGKIVYDKHAAAEKFEYPEVRN